MIQQIIHPAKNQEKLSFRTQHALEISLPLAQIPMSALIDCITSGKKVDYVANISAYLFQSFVFKCQELSLEAKVRVGTSAGSSHSIQRISPTQTRHRHDVGHSHSHAARHSGQTAKQSTRCHSQKNRWVLPSGQKNCFLILDWRVISNQHAIFGLNRNLSPCHKLTKTPVCDFWSGIPSTSKKLNVLTSEPERCRHLFWQSGWNRCIVKNTVIMIAALNHWLRCISTSCPVKEKTSANQHEENWKYFKLRIWLVSESKRVRLQMSTDTF